MFWLWLITLAAAAVQGATGFGFSMIIVPMFALFLPGLGEVTAIAVLCSLLINLLVSLRLFRRAQWKRVCIMTAAAFVGIPAGVFVLTVLDENILKLALGVMIVATGIAMLLNFSVRLKGGPLNYGAVGLVSGFLNGTSGLSGPPVILFMTNQGTEKEVFRANLAVYGVFINLFTLFFLLREGMFTQQVADYCVGGLPMTVGGVVLGMLISGKIPEKAFRTVTILLVTALGVYTAAGAALALF